MVCEIVRGRDAEAVAEIIGELPDWFGMDEANANYVAAARTMDSYLAVEDGRVMGVLLVKPHFDLAAEVHLLIVRPRLHRQGIGTALLDVVERDLVAEGRRVLQVKTLGPSDPDPGYALTRAFYRARGFVPIEELDNMWPGNPCLIMVKALAAATR